MKEARIKLRKVCPIQSNGRKPRANLDAQIRLDSKIATTEPLNR